VLSIGCPLYTYVLGYDRSHQSLIKYYSRRVRAVRKGNLSTHLISRGKALTRLWEISIREELGSWGDTAGVGCERHRIAIAWQRKQRLGTAVLRRTYHGGRLDECTGA